MSGGEVLADGILAIAIATVLAAIGVRGLILDERERRGPREEDDSAELVWTLLWVIA